MRDTELDPAGLVSAALQVARGLDDVDEGYPLTPRLLVLKARGKVFLVVTEGPGEPVVTVKADPAEVDALVHTHPSVRPGRYFSRRTWVSVQAGEGVTRSLVTRLVEDSYDLAAERRGAPRGPDGRRGGRRAAAPRR